MATTTHRSTVRVAPPAAKSAPKRAPLRVVRADHRARTVGTIGTVVAGFFFIVLFALAGLHAIVVQAQAELDRVNADIATLEETRVNSLAERAWYDSPEGLAEAAAMAGLVAAPEVAILAPVAPGRLFPPTLIDPFAGSGVSG